MEHEDWEYDLVCHGCGRSLADPVLLWDRQDGFKPLCGRCLTARLKVAQRPATTIGR